MSKFRYFHLIWQTGRYRATRSNFDTDMTWDIGVGAQSTLGGRTFLSEKYVWKIIKIPELLWYLPEKLTKSPNFTWFLPENARILNNNCPKNIFPDFFFFWGGGRAPLPPVSYAYEGGFTLRPPTEALLLHSAERRSLPDPVCDCPTSKLGLSYSLLHLTAGQSAAEIES